MKSVVLINSACNTGSTGTIAEQIGVKAQENGWESYIAHSVRYSRPSYLTDISESSLINEKLHYIGTLFTDGQGLYSKQNTQQLINTLRRIHPNIIHLHNIHGHYLNYPLLFSYLVETKIPVVWTLHDCWAFTGHCVYFDRIGCDKWRTICKNCAQKKEYPMSWVDNSFRNFTRKKNIFCSVQNMTVVTVSDWLHNLVSHSFLKDFPLITIHNGIDLDKFKPSNSDVRQRLGLEGKFVCLGVANGFGVRKGLADFNKLSEIVDEDIKIVLVGLSKHDMSNLSSKILGISHTQNQQELIDLYSAADVFLNPTYEDNFPTTNLESLACGTPVITYNTGGSPEAIDRFTGHVVEKADVQGMIDAIGKIRKNGKLYYSDNCRKRAELLFNKDNNFTDYLRLYEDLLRSNSKV